WERIYGCVALRVLYGFRDRETHPAQGTYEAKPPRPTLIGGIRMNALLRDVRYGIRSLLKSPGLTLVSTLALTLGIGLTTTMFSIVYGAMMKGLPYPDGDRIMIIQRA